MFERDLHRLTSDAIGRIVSTYNHHVLQGQRGKISFVHGYGSSGKGGLLGPKIRAFLDRHQVEYLRGEFVDGNPGHTILIPGNPIVQRQLRGGLGG